MLITGEIYSDCTATAVDSVKADEEKQRRRDDAASLILYFATAGEDVWSIARDYCTSVTQVRQENDLTEDILATDRMLMIPV